jgi:ribonuclease Z
MFEVVVLGSGAAIPMSGQMNCSFLVRVAEAVILIDCGPGILQQLSAVGATPGDVTHLYITHRHGDHTLGYPMFLLWWLSSGREPAAFPLTVTGQATWNSLEVLMHHAFGDVARQAAAVPRRVFADTEPNILALQQEVTLRTWPLVHSPFAPASGVRVECEGKAAAFTGDTAPCPNVQLLAQDADLLLHEATYCATLSPEMPDGLHGHSTARSAGWAATAAKVKRLGLVHILPQYAGRHDVLLAEAAREFIGEVTAPSAGTVYRL